MNKKYWVIIAAAVFALAALVMYFLRPGLAPSLSQKEAIDRALKDEAKTHGVFTDFRVKADTADLSVQEGLDENWTHILLMGTDGRHSQLNDGRSDSMLIASINKNTKEIKLTSLIRDMLVTLPDSHSEQRINTANRFGGPYLAVKTVNELLGLNITKYCSINFEGFAELVDLAGGVELTLNQGESRIVRLPFSEEPQKLAGWQALTFARIRKLDNNFGRNERQRKVLEALFQKALAMGPKQVLALVPEGLKLISTNLTSSEVLSLLQLVLASKSDVGTLSLPPEHGYRYGHQDDGASVIIFDQEKTKQAFWDFIEGGETPPEEEKKN